MKPPSILRWFRWLPKFEPFKRPEFHGDYVLKKRQEAAAKRLGENSIRPDRAERSRTNVVAFKR